MIISRKNSALIKRYVRIPMTTVAVHTLTQHSSVYYVENTHSHKIYLSISQKTPLYDKHSRKQTRVSEQYGFFYVIPRCKRIKRLILRASPKYGNTGSQGKIREFIMKIKRGLSGTPQDSSSIICLWIFINPIQFGTSDKKKFRETQVVPSFAGNRKTVDLRTLGDFWFTWDFPWLK